MKTIKLKMQLVALILGCSVLFLSALQAAPMPSAPQAPQMDECSKELLLSYYPADFVTETLKKYNVPQDKWAGIIRALTGKEKDIVKTVEDKASKMNPNPLKDPKERQEAVKLFRDALMDVFANAMRSNGVTDESKYQAMLDDVQQQKAKKFAECVQKQKDIPNSPSSMNNKGSNSKAFGKNTNSNSDYNDDED